MRLLTKNKRGFTIIELLVVVAVFSVVMLVATNIFVLTNQASRRTSSAQKMQGDIRFALEAIAREVRFGTIDYTCYDQLVDNGLGARSCDPENRTSATPLESVFGEVDLLALRDLDGNRVRYKVMDRNTVRKLQVCFIHIATESLTKCDDYPGSWEVVTPEEVKIVKGTFFLYPFQNPFGLKSPGGSTPGTSPYRADSQPRVTIVLRTRQTGNDVSAEKISAQTTVISRFYAR